MTRQPMTIKVQDMPEGARKDFINIVRGFINRIPRRKELGYEGTEEMMVRNLETGELKFAFSPDLERCMLMQYSPTLGDYIPMTRIDNDDD